MKFNMAKLFASSSNLDVLFALGPSVNGGASYSVLGMVELCVVRSSHGLPFFTEYDPVLLAVSHYDWWRYGVRSH